MAENSPLTDNEADELLVEAHQALGTRRAASVHANAALEAGRSSLLMLQYGIVAASEKARGRIRDPD